jgi:hypothetical protein
LAVFGAGLIFLCPEISIESNFREKIRRHIAIIGMSALSKGEQRRLGANEADWKLISGHTASRTRGGGLGRPNLGQQTLPDVVVVADNDTATTTSESLLTNSTDDAPVAESEDEASSDIATAEAASGKPTHTRVIIEVSQLAEVFEGYTCPKCDAKLELNLRTVCIATSIELMCNTEGCFYVRNFSRPSVTKIHKQEQRQYERITDYAVNVLYVLGYVSVGDGHTEAG